MVLQLMVVEIKLIGGVWFVNGKRLGHDVLSFNEMQALNEFIIEFKERLKL